VSLPFLHGRIATAMVLFTLVAGVYGLVEYFRKKPVSPNYWGVIVAGNLLALVQGGLGMWMALNGLQPARWVHILYGVVAVLWIPVIQFVNRSRGGRSETLVCALVSLFEFGIALRAMTTGGW
jgi:heme A synthase